MSRRWRSQTAMKLPSGMPSPSSNNWAPSQRRLACDSECVSRADKGFHMARAPRLVPISPI